MSKCFLIRFFLGLFLSFFTGNLFAATTPQLLKQSDFTYLGAFKLPSGSFGPLNDTFDYTGGLVSGNVYDDPLNGKSLFVMGLLGSGISQKASVAQVKIPSTISDPNSVGLNSLATASIVQGFSDPSNGKASLALTGTGSTAVVVYGGKLIGTEAVGYDGNCGQTLSSWVGPINFSQASQATGAYAFSSPVGPRYIGGAFMTPIPPEWQSALGGKVLSGNGPLSIISCASPGPSLHVIDADALINQPAASTSIGSTPLVYYQDGIHSSLGLWNSNSPNQLVNGKQIPSITVTDPFGRGTYTIAYNDNTVRLAGVLFADGTRSVLVYGSKGLGPYCYGSGGTSGDCYDPDNGNKGDHAWPYVPFVWAYDVNDLVAAKEGLKSPWDVLPYTGWAFKVFGIPSNSKVGVSWDPTTRLMYMIAPCSWANCTPLVHVFQVGYGDGSSGSSTSTLVSLTASPNTIQTGSASTLTWNTSNATSCTASGGWSGTKAISGTASVSPASTTTYTLSCTGPTGSASQSATVTVTSSSVSGSIAVSPASISFTTTVGSVPTAQSITVTGPNGANFTTNDSSPFYDASLCWSGGGKSCASGTVVPIKPTSFFFQNAAAGTYSAPLTVSSSGYPDIVVPVTLTITTLSSPAPSQSSTVNVSGVSGLQSAIAGLTSNMTILLADGTYNLTSTLYLPQNISNITIKGASGNREAVVIKGPGMSNSSVPFGFWLDNIAGVTFQDMTIRDFNQHAIIANGGVDSPVYRNLHIIDIGDQFLKNNPTGDGLNGIDNGILENSFLEYSSTAPDTYTNGLDVHRGKNWIVRNNTFKNFRSTGGLTGPAVLIWNGSSDSTVIRNTFINNQRDVSLGLDPNKPVDGITDHARGVIANNFFYKTSNISPDVPIAVFDSPQTKVYYNTVLLNGGYPNAIEYRFPRTTGVDIKNNLTDAAIISRDGASGSVGNNVTNATSGMFVSASTADLHLVSTATGAIDKGVAVAVTDDFDGQARPQGAASDIGADEYSSTLAAPAAPSNLVLQ